MESMAKVTEAAFVNFLFTVGGAEVEQIQLLPELSADAADALAPSQLASVLELPSGETKSSPGTNFPEDPCFAGGRGAKR